MLIYSYGVNRNRLKNNIEPRTWRVLCKGQSDGGLVIVLVLNT